MYFSKANLFLSALAAAALLGVSAIGEESLVSRSNLRSHARLVRAVLDGEDSLANAGLETRDHSHHDNNDDSKEKGNSRLSIGDLLRGTFQGECTHPEATDERPNGALDFLNCGLKSKKGWNPPHVTVDMLKIASADDITKGIFKPCHQHLGDFKAVSKETGIHATILMSVSMQESHCNAHETGPNGEIGMMQVTKENCKGNCWDPHQNIKLGAGIFKQYLNENNGNVLAAIGSYNGWHKGLTESEATSEKYGCWAQQNLAYIDSMVNGWLQGKDGYGKEFQKESNLAKCK